MTSNWRRLHWGDIATLEYGKGLRDYDNRNGAFPVYGTNGLIGSHNEPLCNHPGVIVGRKGAYRGIHYSTKPFFVIDTAFYVKPKENLDLKWAYYQLLTQDINGMDSGSAIPSTSRDAFYHLPVVVPSLSEQRAIARTLGALDDKIELNRRMNQTLEDLARALFQSWFVRFDPVREKAAGRAPQGMDAATAALFPDAWEETAAGRVPAGWEVKKVENVVDFAYGKPLKAENRRTGSVPVYGSNGQVGWHDEPMVSGPGIVVGRKGNPGTVTWTQGEFFPIDTTFYVTRKDEKVGWHFLFYALSQLDLPNLGADSAVPGLNRHAAYFREIVLPCEKTRNQFEEICASLFQRVNLNERENRALAETRDTLLPKLLSGAVRVQDAEERTK